MHRRQSRKSSERAGFTREAGEVYPRARHSWENTLRGNKAGEGGTTWDMNLR